MTRLRRLWPALERVPVQAAVAAEWRAYMGGEFDLARALFRPDSTLATSYPCPKPNPCECGAHEVVAHGPDDLVAACRCLDRCPTVPITRDDIVVWRLDRRKLGGAAATALGANPEWDEVDGLPMTWRVGTYVPLAGYRFPVYLTIQFEDHDFQRTVEGLVARDDGPFILAAPTHDLLSSAGEALLERRGACFLALIDSLSLGAGGRLVADRSPEDLLAKFRAAVLPAPDDDIRAFFATLAGATWEDVSICFTDGHTVAVKVRGESGRLNYTQMGLANSRNGEPTVQWYLLAAFANEGGEITWDSRYANRRNKKRCELLAKDLKAFFRIDGDPIRALPAGRGWRTRFMISAER